jgi:hypothetical protein
MRAWWGKMPWLGVLVVLMASCRTGPPELKPKKVAEVCTDPPVNDRRYDTAYIPKEAFKDMKDPMTRNQMAGPGGPGGPGMGGMASGMGMNPGANSNGTGRPGF